jgi:taurine---2-oxoglutarate transaminase
MITFTKGVTSGYVPLGGMLVSERIARHFDNNVLWAGLTYSGHPWRARPAAPTWRSSKSKGSSIGRAGSPSARSIVGDVRSKGLFWGVEPVKDRGAKEPVAPFSRGGPSR